MTDEEAPILSSRHGRVAILSYNRPEVLNAFDTATYTALRRELIRCDLDDDVGALVLKGAGSSYSTGGDLRHLDALHRQDSSEGVHEMLREAAQAFQEIERLSKPVVSMVHGYCYAGGLGLVLASDITVACGTALFRIPEATVGLIDPYMPGRLMFRVGVERAKFLMFVGEQIDGEEAARIGLVTRAVEESALEAVTLDMAEKLAAQDRRSIRSYKRMTNANLPPLDLLTYFDVNGANAPLDLPGGD